MRIALVGDVMLGRLVDERLRHEGPAHPWGDALPLLAQADLRFANLECVLADDGPPWPGKRFHFRSDRKNVASLEAAGVDVVSLANNHVLDHGVEAMREMLPLLDEHGILHTGAGPDAEAARRPAVCTRAGTAVGFLAFTDNEPGWAAGPASPGVHHVPVDLADDRARDLLQLVRRTRERTDLLVVSAHWGPTGARRCRRSTARSPTRWWRPARTWSSATPRTSSAASRCTTAGRWSTAPGTSSTTTPSVPTSATTSPSSSCSTSGTACPAACACTPR